MDVGSLPERPPPRQPLTASSSDGAVVCVKPAAASRWHPVRTLGASDGAHAGVADDRSARTEGGRRWTDRRRSEPRHPGPRPPTRLRVWHLGAARPVRGGRDPEHPGPAPRSEPALIALAVVRFVAVLGDRLAGLAASRAGSRAALGATPLADPLPRRAWPGFFWRRPHLSWHRICISDPSALRPVGGPRRPAWIAAGFQYRHEDQGLESRRSATVTAASGGSRIAAFDASDGDLARGGPRPSACGLPWRSTTPRIRSIVPGVDGVRPPAEEPDPLGRPAVGRQDRVGQGLAGDRLVHLGGVVLHQVEVDDAGLGRVVH